MPPEITKIEVNWMHKWANKPKLLVTVDKAILHSDFEYMVLVTDKSQPQAQLDNAQSQVVGNTTNPPPPVAHLLTAPPENNFTLLSTNLDPWVKFVAIADPKGNPQMHGALGGEYKLANTNGEIFKSRTGWSSHAGDINKRYLDYLPRKEPVVEVVLYDPRYKTGWAGYNISITALEDLYKNSTLWPRLSNGDKVELIEEDSYWSPSADKYVSLKDNA